jgi:hypothetical protein
MMDRSRLLPLIAQLGGEFSRRNMADHLRQLRLYYLAVKHRLDVRGRVQVDWSADMVVEWMRSLRLKPYEDAYPVQRESGCRYCENRAPGRVITLLVFPGGSKAQCRTCGRVWLNLHAR